MEPLITLRAVTKRYDGAAQPGPRRDRPRRRGRPHHRHHGSVRLRQVDASQPRRCPGPPDERRGRGRRHSRGRPRRGRRGPVPAPKVGFIFQFFHLLDDLSVRDNVAVAALLTGRSHRRGSRRPTRCSPSSACRHQRGSSRLRSAAASDSESRSRGRSSTGPRCCWPTNRPGALDRHNGEVALALLVDLNRRGQTILFVTHDERARRTRRSPHRPARRRRHRRRPAHPDGRVMGAVRTQDVCRPPPAPAPGPGHRGRPVPGQRRRDPGPRRPGRVPERRSIRPSPRRTAPISSSTTRGDGGAPNGRRDRPRHRCHGEPPGRGPSRRPARSATSEGRPDHRRGAVRACSARMRSIDAVTILAGRWWAVARRGRPRPGHRRLMDRRSVTRSGSRHRRRTTVGKPAAARRPGQGGSRAEIPRPAIVSQRGRR